MVNKHYDVIMVGGGVMGCATAYYLLKLEPQLRVAIIEMDASYSRASTPLSDGNHRVQFNLPENIQISQYGFEVLANFGQEMAVDDQQPDIAFRQQGNLFLVDEVGREEAEQGLSVQRSLGCKVDWLSPAEIEAHYPLYQSAAAGWVGGTFSPHDGTMDPWAVLVGYRNKAISLGADFVEAEVSELLVGEKSVGGVRLASGDQILSGFVVNSAGAWAANWVRAAGVHLPVIPVKRQVFVLETAARPARTYPLTVFPSGLYLAHEHEGIFICGRSLPDDPVAFEFDWKRQTFEDHLWPELVDYVPSFDRLRLVRGWAGLYAVNTLDGNAILGEWPELAGLFLANGFSGHGFQQCHAVGRYLAELILDRALSLDLSLFSPQRILDHKPVYESRQRIV